MVEVGMPAFVKSRMVFNLNPGVAARGSMALDKRLSSEVMEMATLAKPLEAIRDKISMSRVTSADLVTIPTGWLAASSTSRISRVTRHCFSIGW